MQREYDLLPECTAAVADFTVGLLLALDRSIVERELKKNSAKWRRDVSVTPPYHALGLMKIGVLGFDAVAREVVKRLRPFGCRLLVYDPGAEEETVRDMGCETAALHDVLHVCDAVTLHLRQSEGAECLIGKEQLALMKPTSWLINVTDASLIEEQALIDAVVHQKIAGVALDTFHREPLPGDYPLVGLPNVILTPHIASAAACS